MHINKKETRTNSEGVREEVDVEVYSNAWAQMNHMMWRIRNHNDTYGFSTGFQSKGIPTARRELERTHQVLEGILASILYEGHTGKWPIRSFANVRVLLHV